MNKIGSEIDVAARLHFEADVTLDRLGQIYGCTRENVRLWLVKAGYGTVGRRGAGMRKRRQTGKRVEDLLNTPAFVEAVNSGQTVQEVTAQFGYGAPSAFRLLAHGSLQRAMNRKRTPRFFTKDAMVRALREVAAALGTTRLAYMQYQAARQAGSPSPCTITLRFGKWSEALLAAGLDPGPQICDRKDRTSDDEILADLAKALDGRTMMTGSEYEHEARKRGFVSQMTVRKRFGGWTAALVKAHKCGEP